jgi:hypothetical protein
MKKIFFASILAFSAILPFSCQKEVSEMIQRRNNTDSTDTGLLYKFVRTYLPDNLDWYISEFEYDSAKHLIFQSNTLKIKQSNGTLTVTNGTMQFFRDNAGRVVRIGTLPDTSSINTIINYENALSSKVVSTYTLRTTVSGATVLDSIVFDYNADNRVLKSSFYQRLHIPAGPLQLTSYQLHQYDSRGNMLQKKVFQGDITNGFNLVITYNFEYDNILNPLYHTDVALFYYDWAYMSPNNITKQKNDYANPTEMDDEHVYSYRYDSLGRPLTLVPDAANIYTYYYH